MASKKKRIKKKQVGQKEHDITHILKGKTSVTPLELIRLIHKVNPTGEGLDKNQTAERYALKARLQSLLIHKFKNDLAVVPDPVNPDIVSLQLR